MPWTDPFLASLRPHRLLAGLIGLQAAATAALLVLAVARFSQLEMRAHAPSGVDETRLLQVRVAGPSDATVRMHERAALGALPGVAVVTRVNQLPFGSQGWLSYVGSHPYRATGATLAAVYIGEAGLRDVLGVRLREGRDFLPDESPMQPMRGVSYTQARHVQISAALAEQLFPSGSALGKPVYFDDQPLRVVGVYDLLHGQDPAQQASLILPLKLDPREDRSYLLRVRDPAPDTRQIEAAIAAQRGRWLVDARSVAQLRQRWFGHDRIAQLMIALGLMLWLAGTAVGIANLADLLLQARLKQIGIRRALGASTGQIRWQLRRENLWLVGCGAALGLLALHALWRLFPALEAALPAPGTPQYLLSWVLMLATGQIALWPVTHEADAVSPALASRRG